LVIKYHANLNQQIGELTKHELLPWLLLCSKHTCSHWVYFVATSKRKFVPNKLMELKEKLTKCYKKSIMLKISSKCPGQAPSTLSPALLVVWYQPDISVISSVLLILGFDTRCRKVLCRTDQNSSASSSVQVLWSSVI
jgi:hypothetical protein